MVKLGDGNYKKLAENCLKIVVKYLNKYNVDWFLGEGTLLGYYREKDFMNHDTDIDIDVYDVDVRILSKLREDISRYIPFDVYREYRDIPYLLAFRINKMRIDLHVWNRYDGYMYRMGKHNFGDRETVFYKVPEDVFDYKEDVFLSIKCNVPKNVEKYLELIVDKEYNIVKDTNQYYAKRDSPALVDKKKCDILKGDRND